MAYIWTADYETNTKIALILNIYIAKKECFFDV